MNIKNDVKRLIKKYDTSDPFKIANDMNIIVLYENLGSMYGYYNNPCRIKQIHINENLPRHLRIFTCAHELGHAIYHPKVNTPFLRNNTGFCINKYEIEANKFAVELLISDNDLLEYQEFTTGQLARMLGYSEELIKLRLK